MSSWILAAKNGITIHMATVCCTYAGGFPVQKLKLQLPKHSLDLLPLYCICLRFILLAVHQKGYSTLWIFSASKENKNTVVRDILFALCCTYVPNVHANDSVARSVYTDVSSLASSSPLGIPFCVGSVLWGLWVQSSRDFGKYFCITLWLFSHCMQIICIWNLTKIPPLFSLVSLTCFPFCLYSPSVSFCLFLSSLSIFHFLLPVLFPSQASAVWCSACSTQSATEHGDIRELASY